MNVWWCVPSARVDGGTLPLWRAAGYRIAVWRNPGEQIDADICLSGDYPGYANAVNALVKAAMAQDSDAAWFVGGGDDTLPDPGDPYQIAAECVTHFRGTFGVMQPTGDRLGNYSIERIAGSPWMGREFCARINGGAGPLWPEYWHCFVDNELLKVASGLGVYWMRKDLVHYHNHWSRHGDHMPEFLAQANSPEHWQTSLRLYTQREAAGFPGSGPITSVYGAG